MDVWLRRCSVGLLASVVLSACQASTPVKPTGTDPGTPIAPPLSTPPPTPTATPAPPTASPTPAPVLTFGEITASTTVCFDEAGGGVATFSLPVTVKGKLADLDYLWIAIQGIDEFSGPTLESTNFDGHWLFDTGLLSDFRGLFLLRVPDLKANASSTLKWGIRDALFGRQTWNVSAYTGPTILHHQSDLTHTGAGYGPIYVTFRLCVP